MDPNVDPAAVEGKDPSEPVDIFVAAEKGDVAAVDEALRMGIEIDVRAESGATPLIAAATAQQPGVVTHLLERGADPNAQKHNHDGALHWACYRGEAAIGEATRLPVHLPPPSQVRSFTACVNRVGRVESHLPFFCLLSDDPHN